MSLCTFCGHPTPGDDALCACHAASCRDDWATGNRIMCDFLHRGIVLPTAPARSWGTIGRLSELATPGARSGARSGSAR